MIFGMATIVAKRPHKHQDLTFCLKGPIQGGSEKSCLVGSLCLYVVSVGPVLGPLLKGKPAVPGSSRLVWGGAQEVDAAGLKIKPGGSGELVES